MLRDVARRRRLRLEWRGGHGGTRSELGTPLWSAIERFVEQLEPGARLAPICVAGFTDSHWLRESVRHGRVRLLPDADDEPRRSPRG